MDPKEAIMSKLSLITSGDKKEILNSLIMACGFFTFPFIICSLVVAGTANAGFNVVLTGLLNAGFVGGAQFVIKNSKTPIAIGFLLGTAGMMAVLNFMTAIYWGQLSKCKYYSSYYTSYSCSQTHAYGAVCAFAVFIFFSQLLFTVGVGLWRGELISEAGLYDEVTSTTPYEDEKIGSHTPQTVSTDL
jgi:hypothetical protein